MSQRLYRNYVETLSQRFSQQFAQIQTNHNFEHGSEFEIALCKVLRSVLPQKYGICRGYAVNRAGDAQGDDIIIFDRMKFPTLGLRDEDLSRKEFVPIEAVYAYIEAKHTIYLNGEDEQSLRHAMHQAGAVKEHVAQRSQRPLASIDNLLHVTPDLIVGTKGRFPPGRNPPYAVVIARQVKQRKRGKLLVEARNAVHETLKSFKELSAFPKYPPDMLILGENTIVLPIVHTSNSTSVFNPFLSTEGAVLHTREVKGSAFAIGLLTLMSALDWMELGALPYSEIIVDAINSDL